MKTLFSDLQVSVSIFHRPKHTIYFRDYLVKNILIVYSNFQEI